MRDVVPPVLVVEDDAGVRRLLEHALLDAGFEVAFATHGAEALRFLRERPVLAVMLDLVLPWVNGIEVLADMRADARLMKVPVLVITGTSTHEHDLRAFQPVVVVRKPFDADRVIEMLRTQLRENGTALGRE